MTIFSKRYIILIILSFYVFSERIGFISSFDLPVNDFGLFIQKPILCSIIPTTLWAELRSNDNGLCQESCNG